MRVEFITRSGKRVAFNTKGSRRNTRNPVISKTRGKRKRAYSHDVFKPVPGMF